VQQGDALSTVARRFGSSVSEISRLNDLPADGSIRIGQELKLPSGVWSDRLGIRVQKPEPRSRVRAPVMVEGTAATFEGQVVVEVLAADGALLGKAFVKASGGGTGEHGPFQAIVEIPPLSTERSVTLRLYWPSPRDGSPTDEIRIPVTLAGSG
jgi:LysM repeat protein